MEHGQLNISFSHPWRKTFLNWICFHILLFSIGIAKLNLNLNFWYIFSSSFCLICHYVHFSTGHSFFFKISSQCNCLHVLNFFDDFWFVGAIGLAQCAIWRTRWWILINKIYVCFMRESAHSSSYFYIFHRSFVIPHCAFCISNFCIDVRKQHHDDNHRNRNLLITIKTTSKPQPSNNPHRRRKKVLRSQVQRYHQNQK